MTLAEAKRFKTDIMAYDKIQAPHHCDAVDFKEYWREFEHSPLGKFALSVIKLVPSSASVERVFSQLSRVKTKYRNRMSTETLTAHGKIKLNELNGERSKKIMIENEEDVMDFSELDFDDDDDVDDEETLKKNGFIESIFDLNCKIVNGEKLETAEGEDNTDWTNDKDFWND